MEVMDGRVEMSEDGSFANWSSRIFHRDEVFQSLTGSSQRRGQDRACRGEEFSHRSIGHAIGHAIALATRLDEAAVLHDVQVLGERRWFEARGDEQLTDRLFALDQ